MDGAEELFQAIRNGDQEAFTRILAADPQAVMARNEQGVSAVLLAAYYRRGDMIAAMLKRGIPLDIWEASATGNTRRVRELLGRAPSLIDAVSPDGFSPLGLAAFFGQEETVQALLDEGAEVNARSRNTMGVTPLHSAVAAGNIRIVETLLDAGADPDPVQQGGLTPLHGAAFAGDAAAVRLLLKAGADASARTDEGKTALDLAQEKRHAEAAEALRGAGGSVSSNRTSAG